MTRGELQTIFERYMDTWKRRDPAALAGHHSADGIVESPMYQTRRGRKEIEESYRAFFTSFPDATPTLEALLIDPPQLASFSTINATHVNEWFGLPGTNRRIEFRHARLFRVDDGLFAHERRIYDFTGLLVKVGVLRAKPA
jgi:predicted ester cyclase